MNALKTILALVVGLLAGGLTVGLIESINMLYLPAMSPIDMSDRAAMEAFLSKLPLAALVVVVVAWGCGSLVGAFVAKRLTPGHRNLAGCMVCALLFLATIFNLMLIPHPAWMWFVGLAMIPIGGLIGLALVANEPYFVESLLEINAPVEKVFEALSNTEEFSKAVPGILKIEFLSDQRRGLGTRFRETRSMNGREATAELEVREYLEGQRIAMVGDAVWSTWGTLFEVSPTSTQGTLLKTTIEGKPKTWVGRLLTPLMVGLVRQAIASDGKSIKAYCER